jgi:hypothetical protein
MIPERRRSISGYWTREISSAGGRATFGWVPIAISQIQNRPGALWIVGNEVDRINIQGDTYPDVYARAYHEVYNFIKERDPSAQVAISGLVQVTPGRLQYLDLVWDAYLNQYGNPMPVDVWTMHIYILPERSMETGEGAIANIALGTDPALAIWDSNNEAANCPRDDVYCYAEHDDIGIFAEQVVDMRTWMKEHGQQNKPLILSEYSILYVFLNYDDPDNPTHCYLMDEFDECFTQQRVSNFMVETFDYMETATNPSLGYPADGNRLVQQWLWYAIHTPVDQTGGSSNLMNDALTQFTQVGQTFHDEVAARSLTTNLFPHEVQASVGFSSGPTATVQITATVRNNGNANAGGPFQVTFYSDQARTNEIGSVEIPGPTNDNAGMVGCARKAITASVIWPDLNPGLHRYWVDVDSGATITESNENDNVKSGLVLIDPGQTFLPTLPRQ